MRPILFRSTVWRYQGSLPVVLVWLKKR